MSFINSLLLDRVAYGFAGSYEFATTQVLLKSGRSVRNAERSRPKYRCSAPFNNIQVEHRALVVNAFNACLGPVQVFRFFDRDDYLLDDVTIGTAVGGADETMQLIKPYTFGGTTTNRNITKPVDSTVDYDRGEEVLGAAPALTLTEDDVSLAFTVDYLTGIVTFTSSAAKVIRATGWFDVPVHFEHDLLTFARNEQNAHTSDIDLVEDTFA
jgi:uncharacterized protein (TIGR02217 family)